MFARREHFIVKFITLLSGEGPNVVFVPQALAPPRVCVGLVQPVGWR